MVCTATTQSLYIAGYWANWLRARWSARADRLYPQWKAFVAKIRRSMWCTNIVSLIMIDSNEFARTITGTWLVCKFWKRIRRWAHSVWSTWIGFVADVCSITISSLLVSRRVDVNDIFASGLYTAHIHAILHELLRRGGTCLTTQVPPDVHYLFIHFFYRRSYMAYCMSRQGHLWSLSVPHGCQLHVMISCHV